MCPTSWRTSPEWIIIRTAQLLLQPFLLRLVNGGGRVDREVASGRGRTDLYIEWPIRGPKASHGSLQKAVFELKVVRKGLQTTLTKALKQAAAYADTNGADEVYLLLVDRRPGKTWVDRIWQKTEHESGHEIGVWGM